MYSTWNNILHITITAVLWATENQSRKIRLFWQNLAHRLQHDDSLLRQATVWATSGLQHKGPGSVLPETENRIPLLLLFLLLLLFPVKIGFMPIWYGLWGKGILPFLAIFFATAGCKIKFCCDNFHTTLTAASSEKGVPWQHFHDRSWVYHTVYHIYSISFVSLRSTDTDIMKFGRKRSVKTSHTWFGRRTKTDYQAETAFVKLNRIPCISEGSVKQ